MSRAVFNFHAPPYGTGLDEAPSLDENMRPVLGGAVMKPVGSTAVKAAIQKYQPISDGVLQGAVLDLNEKKGKVTRYIMVNG